ncbi:hypothetical protein QN277_026204 [Acacia crassicarpa]|uniref:Transposase n=1 Tax=Acacia crassicarpa TaxID=499986 RepID=A0AAE1JAT9_9FABA|nr:hypothetical protein QN277_026204 [Acacia crassicarpa]
MFNLNVGEIGEADCDNAGRDDEEDFDSDDDSYMEHSELESECCDSEESLVDDYEIYEDPENRSTDEDVGNFIGALQERVSGRELDGSETRASFTLDMTFLNRGELRKAIDNYTIEKGVDVKIVRSEKEMVIATCEKGCPFRLYAGRDSVGLEYMLKMLVHEHMCVRVYKKQRASVRWLVEYFKDEVQDNSQYNVTEMKKEVECDLKLFVSRYKCKRAKRMIMEVMDGGFANDYAKLEAYCNELKASNPGSDVSVELSGEALDQRIRRMYVCFNAFKVGWKVGHRPFIGLNGTFLKEKGRSILLTTVDLNANDSIFPLAFALTEKETTVNWSWFIQWLRSLLDLDDDGKVTIMSNMQKGLAHAVSDVLPFTEHRLCARHIYVNWSKWWRGNELKKIF